MFLWDPTPDRRRGADKVVFRVCQEADTTVGEFEMRICDNCRKELGRDVIQLRLDGVYTKMAMAAKVSTNPDLCSPECVIEYCSKVSTTKVML